MATTSLRAESACVTPASIFDERLTAYRIAKAEMDLHQARQTDGYDEEYQRAGDHLVDQHTEIMDCLLMTPCVDQRDLWNKIDVIVREEVHDNWRMASEIMAMLRCDADRLLDRSRPLPARALAAVT
ncbi:hypothetical protein [Novosphingobium sp. HII-3]|uniref:hypothetical protein n=1 Tax=Novosphingobium sp. HII-3 TaxID=2075565 RepID=UPI000CDB18A6|nr:hypothetical protein [Novosphingobium sp. HII-3]